MGSFAETVSRGARMSVWLAEQMLKDLQPEMFARKPALGGKVIDTNHPAFVFGHLSLYPAKWLTVVGLDAAPAAVPARYEELFSPGKECRDDATGTFYPPMKEITEAFFSGHRAAIERLPSIADEVAQRPNPREGRLKEIYPTVGGVLIFYAVGHPMMHLGQVSAWRRCMGLGPVM